MELLDYLKPQCLAILDDTTKASALTRLAEIAAAQAKIDPAQLETAIWDREKLMSTGIGHGIAVPHVRTYQAKEFIIAVGRSAEGIEFEAPDQEPVHLFFCMAAPQYDDKLYLKVFKALAENLQFDYFRESLLAAEQEYDIIRAFKDIE